MCVSHRKNRPISVEEREMDKRVSYPDTGTIFNPLTFEMFISYDHPENETYFLALSALSQRFTSCLFNLSIINETTLKTSPKGSN
jgi:hypothetical protein